MADPIGAAAIRGIREGLSARAALRSFREGGGATGNERWFRVFAEAKAAVAGREREVFAPLNRRPTADEMVPWSEARRPGVAQQVEVFVRDRSTNTVKIIPHTTVSSLGVTRQDAIDQAISDMGKGTKDSFPDEVVEGAVYVGTFLMGGSL